MTSPQLNNLVKVGQLKTEPGSQAEFNGLLHSGKARLIDARNTTLAIESRFDLAYNAAHALALAALRWPAFALKIVTWCFKHSNIRWVLSQLFGAFWQSVMKGVTLPNTKVILKLTTNLSPT